MIIIAIKFLLLLQKDLIKGTSHVRDEQAAFIAANISLFTNVYLFINVFICALYLFTIVGFILTCS